MKSDALTATQESALESLCTACDALTDAKWTLTDAVLRCRGVGLSWETIAEPLGMSRQAAWEKFAPMSRFDRPTD